VPEEMFAF